MKWKERQYRVGSRYVAREFAFLPVSAEDGNRYWLCNVAVDGVITSSVASCLGTNMQPESSVYLVKIKVLGAWREHKPK